MGDLFARWLTPPEGLGPLFVCTAQYEMFAYSLPDEGRLARHLANAGSQQWPESDSYIARLREAVAAWQGLVERALLIVLRQPLGGSVSDEEIMAALQKKPDWV